MHTLSSWKRMWDSYLCDLNMEYGIKARLGEKNASKYSPEGVGFVIPRITPHWLRHTYATVLYLSGLDVLAAKELPGHTDIKTTLEIHTHLDGKHKGKNTAKLEVSLDEKKRLNKPLLSSRF